MSAGRPTVAVVGLGAMGARLARNLLHDGYPVVVANRSPAAADPLVAAGADLVTSPKDAARQADVVLVAVTDDSASKQVWTDGETGLLQGAGTGQVVVECSTLSPGWVTELAGTAATAGLRFVEAPMVGSRAQVEGRTLVHLVGGEESVLTHIRDVLAVSAPTIHHCGPVGSAATTKLVVNALLAIQVAAAAELLGVAEKSGLSPADTLALLATLPVASPAFTRTAGLMLSGSFAPQFTTDLVAKDLRYLAAAAGDAGTDVPLARAALAGYAATAAGGHGAEDLTSIARLFLHS